jgi:hypothetical protein
MLGWLNGGFILRHADAIPKLRRLRTDGVGIGVIAALLLVQEFLGASVTHGMDHMMF